MESSTVVPLFRGNISAGPEISFFVVPSQAENEHKMRLVCHNLRSALGDDVKNGLIFSGTLAEALGVSRQEILKIPSKLLKRQRLSKGLGNEPFFYLIDVAKYIISTGQEDIFSKAIKAA